MSQSPPPAVLSKKNNTYSCGTLTYTKVGLFVLFGWLLWGDFCYTLMEAVIPSILPLKLKSLDSPNWLIGMIMTTLPGALNMTICPWISFKSDRYRSKWGRRIPFILWTLPLLCVSLAMLGFSDDITVLIQDHLPEMRKYAPATVTIAVVAIFMIMFQFFNMFVSSVFCCLFNDVVPPQFFGRFMGALRIIGTGAGAFYNFFIFKYANTHMREIFLGAAILYFIGIGLMCLIVREGEYPPLEGETDKDNKGWGGLKTFFKESFSHKFYWFRFLSTATAGIGWSIGIFSMFFSMQMGLNLDQIGKTTAVTSVVTMSAIAFMATFVDRWHPLRVTTYSAIFGVIGNIVIGVWLFVTLPGEYFFWIGLGGAIAGVFLNALLQTAGFPCEMRIFPKSRFGQFCSAQAMSRAACTSLSGIAAGLFIDTMKWLCNGSDFAYRFIFVWSSVFSGISAFFLVLVYIEWNKMGGDKNFHPPAPWSPDGVEEMPVTPTVGPQARWLNIAFLFFDGIMAVSVFCIPFMAWWMYVKNQAFSGKYYLFVLLLNSKPLSFLGMIIAMFLCFVSMRCRVAA